MVVLIFMIVVIPIAFVTPTTGEIKEQPLYPLFWASIAGMCIIIVYSSYKERKERQRENRRRRFKK